MLHVPIHFKSAIFDHFPNYEIKWLPFAQRIRSSHCESVTDWDLPHPRLRPLPRIEPCLENQQLPMVIFCVSF